MLAVRRADERFRTSIGWLDSRHTFSFAEHDDPHFRGFGALRVINDDVVAPGAGFPTHPHRDMEILTYVLEGALAHKDSLGNGATIHPGEVQIMSAGTGIRHSEFNASATARVHLLQIWMLPDKRGIAPRYDQKPLPPSVQGGLGLIGSRRPGPDAVLINQDIDLYAARLESGTRVVHRLAEGRHAWVHVARGGAEVAGAGLAAGDGAAIGDLGEIAIVAGPQGAEVLLFDLA